MKNLILGLRPFLSADQPGPSSRDLAVPTDGLKDSLDYFMVGVAVNQKTSPILTDASSRENSTALLRKTT